MQVEDTPILQNSQPLLHFEDFHPGQTIDLGAYLVTRDEILEFAHEFDPQPFHVNETSANASVLGGTAASGWHNCAILMRLICNGYLNRTAGLGSPGMDEVKWLKPVYPGETLRGEMTVLAARRSQKQPERGILTCRWDLTGPDGERKIEITGVNFVKARAS